MTIDFSPFIDSTLSSIDQEEYFWAFHFSWSGVISTEAPWRLVSGEGVVASSDDHDQIFWWLESVNSTESVLSYLASRSVVRITVDIITWDLTLYFTDEIYLQFLQLSSGYESWNLNSDGKEYICLGWGKISLI